LHQLLLPLTGVAALALVAALFGHAVAAPGGSIRTLERVLMGEPATPVQASWLDTRGTSWPARR
jgi:hypothetical protein